MLADPFAGSSVQAAERTAMGNARPKKVNQRWMSLEIAWYVPSCLAPQMSSP